MNLLRIAPGLALCEIGVLHRLADVAETTVGATLLAGSRSAVVRMARVVALAHHERWDGRGYPHGLRRHDIPLAARIVAVADVFDALVHHRPYKDAWPVGDALAEIVMQRDRHFDPRVVEAFQLLDHHALTAGVDPSATRRRAA